MVEGIVEHHALLPCRPSSFADCCFADCCHCRLCSCSDRLQEHPNCKVCEYDMHCYMQSWWSQCMQCDTKCITAGSARHSSTAQYLNMQSWCYVAPDGLCWRLLSQQSSVYQRSESLYCCFVKTARSSQAEKDTCVMKMCFRMCNLKTEEVHAFNRQQIHFQSIVFGSHRKWKVWVWSLALAICGHFCLDSAVGCHHKRWAQKLGRQAHFFLNSNRNPGSCSSLIWMPCSCKWARQQSDLRSSMYHTACSCVECLSWSMSAGGLTVCTTAAAVSVNSATWGSQPHSGLREQNIMSDVSHWKRAMNTDWWLMIARQGRSHHDEEAFDDGKWI